MRNLSHTATHHVFVVESDVNIGMLIEQLLLDQNYRVTRVTDGLGALQAVDSQPAPDLILLNLSMPFVDGHVLLSRIKGQGWAKTPVILLGVRSSEQDIVRGLKAGASDYLITPFHLDEIVVRTRRQLQRENPISPDPVEQSHPGVDNRSGTVAIH